MLSTRHTRGISNKQVRMKVSFREESRLFLGTQLMHFKLLFFPDFYRVRESTLIGKQNAVSTAAYQPHRFHPMQLGCHTC